MFFADVWFDYDYFSPFIRDDCLNSEFSISCVIHHNIYELV